MLCLLIVLWGCEKPKLESCDNTSLEVADALDDDDREIYTLILSTYYPDGNTYLAQEAGNEILTSSAYATFESFQLLVDSEIVENYALRNSQFSQLPDDFIAPLVSNEEIDCLGTINPDEDGNADFWTNYSTKYPDSKGFIDLNYPGYDANRTNAILEYGQFLGNLGANGYIFVLEKVGDQWIIVKRLNSWVS